MDYNGALPVYAPMVSILKATSLIPQLKQQAGRLFEKGCGLQFLMQLCQIWYLQKPFVCYNNYILYCSHETQLFSGFEAL